MPSASKPAATPPLNITSKRMTVVGLAPPPKPAPKPLPAVAPEEEEEDATATATAPRVPPSAAASVGLKPSLLPITIPGPVQIREMPSTDEDALDETEVRTMVAPPTEPPPVPAEKLGLPKVDEEEEELEDSVTTTAPSAVKGARLPEDRPEPKTSPPLRMPPPIPAAGRSPYDQPPIRSKAASDIASIPTDSNDDEDAYNAEESVTTRGPAPVDLRLDDSTTDAKPIDPPESSGRWPSPISPNNVPATMSQALGLPPIRLPPAIEDGTEGTTQRPPRPNAQPSALAQPPVLGADGEGEDDAQQSNRTAVMIGAPVRPPVGGPPAGRVARAGGMASHAAAAQAQDIHPDPSASESGLRIAPQEQPPAQRASLGAMMAGALAANDRGSSSQSIAQQSSQVPYFPNSEPVLALGATVPANFGPLALVPGPSPMQQYDFAATIKKPRYGLLVGLVALLSFAIPLVLFLWLHQSVQEPLFRSPSEVASDHVGLVPPAGTRLAAPSASAPHRRPGRR